MYCTGGYEGSLELRSSSADSYQVLWHWKLHVSDINVLFLLRLVSG